MIWTLSSFPSLFTHLWCFKHRVIHSISKLTWKSFKIYQRCLFTLQASSSFNLISCLFLLRILFYYNRSSPSIPHTSLSHCLYLRSQLQCSSVLQKLEGIYKLPAVYDNRNYIAIYKRNIQKQKPLSFILFAFGKELHKTKDTDFFCLDFS